jgi:hypothetical protein
MLVCVLAPFPAFAQWTASAYVGKTRTQASNLNVVRQPDTDVFFNNVGFDDRSFSGPLYYGARAGYGFTPTIGFEGEFIHIKAFARVDEPAEASGMLPPAGRVMGMLAPSIVLQQYNVSHGLNLILGNLILRHEFIPRLDAVFRAGLGVTVAHPEIRAFGEALDEYQLHGAAIQLAGGAEFELTRPLFVLGEYKFTSTSPRFEIGGARIESSFATHHLVAGLGFRF